MKNVTEISNGIEVIGFIQSMEFGAILNKQKDGTGIINYQGNYYQATKEQMDSRLNFLKFATYEMECLSFRSDTDSHLVRLHFTSKMSLEFNQPKALHREGFPLHATISNIQPSKRANHYE